MKMKRLHLVVSVISFLTILFTSCSEDGVMDRSETGGGTPPPPPIMTKSINILQTDSIVTTPYLPKD